MKTKTMALALLLMASASGAALAQDEARDREPRARLGPSDQPSRPVARGVYTRRAEPAPTAAPEARRAPEARPAPEGRPARDAAGERRGRGGAEPGDRVGRPGRWVDRDGDADTSGLRGGDLQDHEDRTETREWRRWNGGDGDRRGREPQAGGDPRPRDEGDRDRGRDGPRGEGRRDGDRRDGDRVRGDGDRRPDGDRGRDRRWDGDRDGRRGDGDRRWDHDRDGRRPPPNVARWDRRHYPPVYTSRHRYRGHIWRAPVGFYVHTWVLGEVLPRGWYDEPYRLMDWWNYGLPMPPPGYDWVRVGYDAILVDRWSGRVLQVVRMVFW
jgi:hypothetical protein